MMSVDLSASELIAWIDLLAESKEGQIKVINLFQSLNWDLVKGPDLCSFIQKCLTLRPTTSDAALTDFNNICATDIRYFALNRVDPMSIKNTTKLATTMNSLTFHQYVLARPQSVVKPVLSDKPRSRNSDDENDYQKKLERTISDNNSGNKKWYNLNGSLGKPFPDPRHVWFTDVNYINDEIQTNTRRVTEATKVRDALGLIDTRDGHFLLSLQFPAVHLHTLADLQMARPVFSDGGNRRFAVYINMDAKNIYVDNWGQTVHLEKLRAWPPQKINGLPERICSPIPLSHIGDSLHVRPLGWVDVTDDAEDETFIDQLYGLETLDTIKRQLQGIATKP